MFFNAVIYKPALKLKQNFFSLKEVIFLHSFHQVSYFTDRKIDSRLLIVFYVLVSDDSQKPQLQWLCLSICQPHDCHGYHGNWVIIMESDLVTLIVASLQDD